MTTIQAGLPGNFRATAAPEPAASPAMQEPWPVLKPPAMQEPWPKPTPPAAAPIAPIVRPPVDGGPVVTRVDG